MASRKYVIFLGDGMADRPHPELGGRTPLQVAYKPNMDRIAREGRTGMLATLDSGMETGSDTAHLSLMGYDVAAVSQGRAVLEAASMGVDIPVGSIGMRCNIICLHPDGRIKNHSAGHITSEESDELLKALQARVDPARMRFHTGVSYRHLFVAPGLDHRLVCAPPHDHPNEPHEGLLIKPRVPEAAGTAAQLNDLIRLSQQIFADHPVNRARVAAGKDPGNSIWLWSPGIRPSMWTYPERFGVRGAVISAVDLIHGIGVYAGLDKITVEGATGLWNTNYEGKADACLKALETRDFVFLHVEAPDEAGHEGDVKLKVRTIEDFDRRCIGRVLDGIAARGWDAVVAVLPDHATPASTRVHATDPVPFAILDPKQPADAVTGYDETQCQAGAFGSLRGDAFIRAFFGKP